MALLPWASGYKKISHKARRGRRKKPMAHKSHRKRLPPAYDRDRATERRLRLIELQARDLDAEID